MGLDEAKPENLIRITSFFTDLGGTEGIANPVTSEFLTPTPMQWKKSI